MPDDQDEEGRTSMEPSAPVESSELRLIRVEQVAGTTCLTVEGEVDAVTGDYFRRTVMTLVNDPGVARVLLNIAGLEFIDSNGVTVLVKAHRAAGERGVHFAIVETTDNIRGLLELLGVYDMLSD
jgi:anti-sigma B factor antagonist